MQRKTERKEYLCEVQRMDQWHRCRRIDEAPYASDRTASPPSPFLYPVDRYHTSKYIIQHVCVIINYIGTQLIE